MHKTAATCFELLKVEEGLWSFSCVRGSCTDEQRSGTSVAPRRDLETDQWRNRQCAREPFRGANADRGGNLSATRPKRSGPLDLLL